MFNLSEKGRGIREMFDAIAPRYDLLNRLLSLGIDRRWRAFAVGQLHLPEHGKILDVATGTGDVALEIASRSPASTSTREAAGASRRASASWASGGSRGSVPAAPYGLTGGATTTASSGLNRAAASRRAARSVPGPPITRARLPGSPPDAGRRTRRPEPAPTAAGGARNARRRSIARNGIVAFTWSPGSLARGCAPSRRRQPGL